MCALSLALQVLYELPPGIVIPQPAAAPLSSSEEDTQARSAAAVEESAD
jgi:hypothetical protein